jgi:hypothetical protein
MARTGNGESRADRVGSLAMLAFFVGLVLGVFG